MNWWCIHDNNGQILFCTVIFVLLHRIAFDETVLFCLWTKFTFNFTRAHLNTVQSRNKHEPQQQKWCEATQYCTLSLQTYDYGSAAFFTCICYLLHSKTFILRIENCFARHRDIFSESDGWFVFGWMYIQHIYKKKELTAATSLIKHLPNEMTSWAKLLLRCLHNIAYTAHVMQSNRVLMAKLNNSLELRWKQTKSNEANWPHSHKIDTITNSTTTT